MTFDGTNKIIILDSGITSYTATELYSEWKQWVISGVGASIEAAYSVSGNIPVGGGVATGAFFILINGWKIRPPEENLIINISGNIYAQDGILTLPTLGNFTSQINITRATDSTITSGGTGGTTPEEIYDYFGQQERGFISFENQTD